MNDYESIAQQLMSRIGKTSTPDLPVSKLVQLKQYLGTTQGRTNLRGAIDHFVALANVTHQPTPALSHTILSTLASVVSPPGVTNDVTSSTTPPQDTMQALPDSNSLPIPEGATSLSTMGQTPTMPGMSTNLPTGAGF